MSRQATADGEIVILKDPDRDRFFRLPPAAHFIAGQLDGTTTLEVVRDRAEKRFQAALPQAALAEFVQRLDQAGLLESAGRERRDRRRGRLAGSLLYLRYRLIDPDRILDRLAGPCRFLFTPGFVLFSAVLIIAAAAIAAANWDEILATLAGFYRLSSIPLISLVIFLVITLHEFGHGLTCKHFGGRVREMGLLLIYFQPALYCNVSDAWLFPEKSRRLWVGLAGPWIELFAWAVAVLVWRITDAGTLVNRLAFIVLATSGIKTLFNFNPLIKLDGYYLLSDWLEIPNLRRRAFAWLGAGIRRLAGLGAVSPTASARESRVFLAYGLVATAGSFALLAVTLLQIGGYFIERSQPLLLALLTTLAGMIVHRRWTRLFGPTGPAPSDEPLLPAGVGSPPTAPSDIPPGTDPPGDAQPPGKRKSRRAKARAWARLKLALLAILTLALLFVVRMDLRIAGPFDALPVHNADVRAEISGIVEEVLVDEGDVVRSGDVIARLTGRDERADLRKTLAGLARARARLALLEAGPTQEEIRLAQTSIERALDQLQFARAHFTRSEALFEKSLITAQEHDKAREAVTVAGSDVDEARAKLEVVRRRPRPEELAAARAEIAGLEAERSHLEEQIRLLEVRSPAAGVVATPARTLQETVYKLVQKGDLIAKVHELETITAQIEISEKDIGEIRIGQEVRLRARAFPEITFSGRVTAIAAAAVGGASPAGTGGSAAGTTTRTVLVTTEIDNRSGLLKPAMTGQAKVYCGERRLVDLVVRRLARTVRVEFWSWW